MRYEIGGLCVTMSTSAADRWNAGITTVADLRKSTVYIPDEYRTISLRRAFSERLEPKIFHQIHGMPANPIE